MSQLYKPAVHYTEILCAASLTHRNYEIRGARVLRQKQKNTFLFHCACTVCDPNAYGNTTDLFIAHLEFIKLWFMMVGDLFLTSSRQVSHALLFQLLLTSVFVANAQNTSAPAQSPSPTPIPTWAKGHIEPHSPQNVVTKTLPTKALKPLTDITTFFREFADEVRKNNEAESRGGDTGDVNSRTCNMQSSDWATRADTYLMIRGLESVDTQCATEREVKDNKNITVDLVDVLPKWANLLNETSSSIADSAGLPWGSKAAGVARFWYPDRENQNCTLFHTMGIRSKGIWYVQARITADNSSNENTAGSDNSYIIEHITPRSPTVFGSPLVMTRLPINENATQFGASTTSLELWSRPAPDSVGVNADISRNVAFRAALSDGDNWHQQAQDAEQVSNIAILLLPLAMNLVPVALIADVNTFGMLLYTALTDVLTTVPLCIKGVELISISKRRFTATSAQITGALEAGSRETAVAEAWVAKCRLKDHARHFNLGVIFVVLSITLMMFGVACEFVARWYVKKRTNAEQLPIAGQHGGHGTYGTSSSYQPFTAAALTLQNRVPSRGPNNVRSPGAAASTQLTPIVPAPYGPHAGHIPGTHGHVHGNNCPCACHSAHHSGTGPEYDARGHPDPLARKYH